MTELEKLELAAKACGIELTWEHGTPQTISLFRGHLPNYEDWNPHADQADSDRMACDLEIDTFFNDKWVNCKALGYTGTTMSHNNTIEGRRAAVREARMLVAVEIGRAMK